MNKIKLPKIGLRTLKSALAVFLCLVLLPNEPFFSCLTAVICLQDTVANSIKMAMNRGLGTLIGGILGLLFLLTFIEIDSFISNIFVFKGIVYTIIAIGIVVVITTCNTLKIPGAISVACIVFLAVTTAHAYTDPGFYATNRMLETFMGIIISLLVNRFILPPKGNLE